MPGDVFSVPNAIAVSERFCFAMLDEPAYISTTHKFEQTTATTLKWVRQVASLAASEGSNIYYIGKEMEGTPYCSLWVRQYPDSRETQIPLEQLCTRVRIPPMAVSPDGRTVAVGDSNGLLVGVTEGALNTWRIYALGSSYLGDGGKPTESRSHLYFLTAPKN